MKSLVILLVLLSLGSCIQLVCNCSNVVNWKRSQPMNLQLSTVNGSGAYLYQGLNLPPGISMNGSLIFGAPTQAGTYNVTVSASDERGNVASKIITINVIDGGSTTLKFNEGRLNSIQTSGAVQGAAFQSSASQFKSSSISENSASTNVIFRSGAIIGAQQLGGYQPSTAPGPYVSTPSPVGTPNNLLLFTNPNYPNGVAPSIPGTSTVVTSGALVNTNQMSSVQSNKYSSNGLTTITISTGSNNGNLDTSFSANSISHEVRMQAARLADQILNNQNLFDEKQNGNQMTSEEFRRTLVYAAVQDLEKTKQNLVNFLALAKKKRQQFQISIKIAQKNYTAAENQYKQIEQSFNSAQNKYSNSKANFMKANENYTTIQGLIQRLLFQINAYKNYTSSNTTLQKNLGLKIQESKDVIAHTQQRLFNVESFKASIDKNMSILQENIAKIQNEQNNISLQVNLAKNNKQKADNNIKTIESQILELTAQLDALKAKRSQQVNKSQYYENLPYTGPSKIAFLNHTLQSNSNQLNKLKPQLESAKKTITQYAEEIVNLQNSIQKYNFQIKQTDLLIQDNKIQGEKIQNKLAQLQLQIQPKKKQLSQLELQMTTSESWLNEAIRNSKAAKSKVENSLALLNQLRGRLKMLGDYTEVAVQQYDQVSKNAAALKKSKEQQEESIVNSFRNNPPISSSSSISTYKINGPILENGNWYVSGTLATDGTTVGKTASGVFITARQNNATGKAYGIENKVYRISGSGYRVGTTIGHTLGGDPIIADGQSAPLAGSILGRTSQGYPIISLGTSLSSPDNSGVLVRVRVEAPEPKPTAPTGSLNNYMSEQFIRGVSPSSLYNFYVDWAGISTSTSSSSSTSSRSTNSRQSFSCQSQNTRPQNQAARIRQIDSSAGTLTVEGYQGRQVLRLGGCSNLRSNRQNYQFNLGDMVTWQGYDANPGVINVVSLTASS